VKEHNANQRRSQARSAAQAAPPASSQNVDSTAISMENLDLNDDEDLFAQLDDFDSGLSGRFQFYVVYSGRITGIFRNWYAQQSQPHHS
jgi:hypothetical protein